MQAIILAGGFGTRLKPLTEEIPKPMIPVLNKPLMEYSVELLKKHGINEVGVTLMYLPQYIRSYFGDGTKYDLKIKYIEEETPMGTAGSVKLLEEFIDGTFVVLSGDALTNIDITKIHKYHKSIGADVTIVLSKQTDPLEYGVVLTDTTGKIISFKEKPQWENVVTNTVNTGIYLIKKHVLDKIPTDRPFDFSKDLFPMLMKENYKLYGYITEDYWCDLGNPEMYLKAVRDVLNGKYYEQKYENVLEENVKISENTKLIPPVYISKNTIINGKSFIGPNCVIGENCILENADINNSVVWNNSIISKCGFNDTIIGSNTEITKTVFGANNIVGSNVTLKNNVQLKNGATVCNNLKVPPYTIVDGILKKTDNIKASVWQDGSVTGIWNHQIKYAHLQGIAASFKYDKIVIGYNKTALSSTLAGLLASYYSLAGTTSYISASSENALRFYCSVNNVCGVYIFEENERLNIQLIDSKGLNISSEREKKIDFSLSEQSLTRGKIYQINSLDSDFEYYLNATIPVTKINVEVYSDIRMKLHNIINVSGDFVKQGTTVNAAVIEDNGTVTDIYYDNKRISSVDFMKLKIELLKMLGSKKIFLPPYAPDEVVKNAENEGFTVLKALQHKGNSMQQAEKFNSNEILIEYVPHFFALALSLYLQKEDIKQKNDTVISRYDFDVAPQKALNTIFAMNKNRSRDKITARYKNGYITLIPRNNGFSFTAYTRFNSEEYSADIVEEFINSSLN